MKASLVKCTLVLTANDINLSIFKPPWLSKTGIFHEQELQGKIVLSPMAVQIPTEGFQLTVLPDRIQMAVSPAHDAARADIDRVLGGIVNTLPHTPYAAVGLNFHFLLAVEEHTSISSYTRRSFASPFANGLCEDKAVNPKFGSYFSFDALGARLKADIKPIRVSGQLPARDDFPKPGDEVVKLDFNYHYDVIDDEARSEAVLSALGRWEEALRMSQQIVAKLPE